MSTHTKGPWTLGNENNQNYEICIGDAVANIDRQDRFSPHMAFSREEMIANGRLIIAAPDMLEALEELWSYLEETGNHIYFPDVESVIAKAKGESLNKEDAE